MQCDQVLRINLSARPKNDIARKAVRDSKNPKSAQKEDIELTCFQLEPVAFDMRTFASTIGVHVLRPALLEGALKAMIIKFMDTKTGNELRAKII